MTYKNTDVAIIRTHFFNSKIRRLRATLNEHFHDNVYVALPQRALNELDSKVPHIALNETEIESYGLYLHKRWEWLCGDYWLYAARAKLPTARRFWMIEHDVYLNFDRASTFFSRFDDDPSDFLASDFDVADESWPWYNTMKSDSRPVMQCLFSLTRTSSSALDFLLEQRQQLSKTAAIENWPNDEAFVATSLSRARYRCSSFREADGVTEYSFGWRRPHSYDQLRKRGADNLVYHPVRSADGYLKKAWAFVSKSPQLFHEISNDLKLECGEIKHEMVADFARGARAPVCMVTKALNCQIVSSKIEDRTVRFAVSDPDDVIQSEHLKGRFYEWQELSIIGKHFRADGVFCDIGANVGNHLLYVGLFLQPARILAIEPHPRAVEMLELNVALNDLGRIVDLTRTGMGLGNHSGVASIATPTNNLGGSTLTPGDPSGTIPIGRGDDHLSNEKIDFLKIDVEGGELKVLEGLEETINRGRPNIFIEVQNSNISEFETWVSAHSYQIVETYRRYRICKNYLLTAVNSESLR